MDSHSDHFYTSGNERTLGDGMDNSLLSTMSREDSLQSLSDLNIKPSKNVIRTFKPIEPKSRVFNLVPKYIPKERTKPKYLTNKPKEPKFIPYEPYKGAVEPIVVSKQLEILKPKLLQKNNIEIHHLADQLSEMRVSELKKNTTKSDSDCSSVPIDHWKKERLALETDIKNLRESNSHLANQLKFQAQVNSELKTLLVAAVGEDLESRVQHLTEDKLQLARALLNSANHLTSHQEQTEWLSGQCEVWRSKFLASSLMVEELARWKSSLSNRINDMQETLRNILDEHFKAHKKELKSYCYLKSSLEKVSSAENTTLKTANLGELSSFNCHLSEKLAEALAINKDDCDKFYEKILKLPQNSIAVKNGQKLLQNPVSISTKQDAICNALRGTAMSLSGEQMYLKEPTLDSSCCSHCTGEFKNI